MTIKNMVEMVKQHHPNVSETQIFEWLNQAMEEITDKTSFAIQVSDTFTTVSGTKYYNFDTLSNLTDSDEVISIETVQFKGEHIPFVREPEHMEGY